MKAYIHITDNWECRKLWLQRTCWMFQHQIFAEWVNITHFHKFIDYWPVRGNYCDSRARLPSPHTVSYINPGMNMSMAICPLLYTLINKLESTLYTLGWVPRRLLLKACGKTCAPIVEATQHFETNMSSVSMAEWFVLKWITTIRQIKKNKPILFWFISEC